MNSQIYLISKDTTIQEALKVINNNQKGFVLIQDELKRVIGIATDGDIRRKLLENFSITDSILLCINKDFVKAYEDTPRELLLKQLDNHIRVIPILDNEERFLSIVT